LDAQRQEFEKRLNEYEDILNEKSAKDNETSNRLKKLEELLKIKEKENADLRSEIALKSQSPIAKSKPGETLSVPRPRIINPNLIKQN
jgi:DNA primase large subunit